ncbi:MAG: glycogen debranching protein GlgX [Anaerolineae bacterium]|nr:MAG: glycogen debranching protein GlgX [Anaerolineae bacterium]MCL4879589.1 glycogen debranching protein GlgX [Anaerolineae bacterium]
MFKVRPGYPRPLGATVVPGGVNFSLCALHATGVQILFFEYPHDEKPMWTYKFDPVNNRTYDFWHVLVEGVKAGMFYAYRVEGPWDIKKGHRYNPSKVLVDPYARGYVLDYYSRKLACQRGDNVHAAPKSVIIDLADYDWEGDTPLNYPFTQTIIYEMHVRGFTRDSSSEVRHPGTYHGVIEKIPYLQELGVTAVELLPVHEYDQTDVIHSNPITGVPLLNYWGYSTVGFFAPESSYSHDWDTGQQVREFRDLVKALHRAGIEVILDVVYNHTTEGDENGPTLCYRGIDNSMYYILNERGQYMNYSGTGNTLNTNHPIVRTMIMDSLRYWVEEMHVDGFRFDLASILSRDELGRPLKDPPIIWAIENDPVLQNTKLIAEAWDAGGLYQVGGFPGYHWAEWNGKFRDDVRSFIRGDDGYAWNFANRIMGSHDVYAGRRSLPHQSINFVTSHDGFTLNDLVSYNDKHNFFNGENNQDGSSDNRSWNCGEEGPSDDPQVEGLRSRQIRNFLTILLISQGTPMILGGDEIRRTQLGNNNAYCQDNQISWYDWTLLDHYGDLFRFTKWMIQLRKDHPVFQRERYFSGEIDPTTNFPDIEWHGIRLHKPDFGHYSHALAFTLAGLGVDNTFHVIVNSYWESLEFELPELPRGWYWLRLVDTTLPSPEDICEPGGEIPVTTSTYWAGARSIVILMTNDR